MMLHYPVERREIYLGHFPFAVKHNAVIYSHTLTEIVRTT